MTLYAIVRSDRPEVPVTNIRGEVRLSPDIETARERLRTEYARGRQHLYEVLPVEVWPAEVSP